MKDLKEATEWSEATWPDRNWPGPVSIAWALPPPVLFPGFGVPTFHGLWQSLEAFP